MTDVFFSNLPIPNLLPRGTGWDLRVGSSLDPGHQSTARPSNPCGATCLMLKADGFDRLRRPMSDDVHSPARDLSALRIQRDPDRPRSRAPWIVLALVLAAGAGIGGWAWQNGRRAAEVETGWVRLVGSG